MTPSPRQWVALDLGSNSFHMLLIQEESAGFVVVDRLKEKVQLLAGFDDGRIADPAFERGIRCLRRFAQRARSVPAERITLMGTYALRAARNSGEFCREVERIFGTALNVISGQEEAELIFDAVVRRTSRTLGEALVIDIGGGSTELARGSAKPHLARDEDGSRRSSAQSAVSVEMGCVAFKDRYFSPPMTQSTGFAAARNAARACLQTALCDLPTFSSIDTSVACLGTSGTVESVQTVLRANGWDWEEISREGIERLSAAIVDEQWIVDAGLPGLAPDRVDIFPAGVAILAACFDVLGIDRIRFADVSLLHGMVFKALDERDRLHESTPSQQTAVEQQAEASYDWIEHMSVEADVRALARRFSVDAAQADRVWRTARALFDQSDSAWWDEDTDCLTLLRWACQLHEIGMRVNARHYHRHGSYIIKHADLPGMDQHRQSMLALLIRGHRRSLPGLAFQAFDPQLSDMLLRLVALLRIAVILERSHNDSDSPQLRVRARGRCIELDCGDGWLDAHPLSAKELEVEAEQLQAADLTLSFT